MDKKIKAALITTATIIVVALGVSAFTLTTNESTVTANEKDYSTMKEEIKKELTEEITKDLDKKYSEKYDKKISEIETEITNVNSSLTVNNNDDEINNIKNLLTDLESRLRNEYQAADNEINSKLNYTYIESTRVREPAIDNHGIAASSINN